MIRPFGLILSFLLLFSGFALAACPAFDDGVYYYSSVTILENQTCFFSNQTLLFIGGSYSGAVTTVHVLGTLVLENTSVLLSPQNNTLFFIDGGTLITNYGSIFSAKDLYSSDVGNVSFYFKDSVNTSLLYSTQFEQILDINSSNGLFHIKNSSFRSHATLPYLRILDSSFLDIEKSVFDISVYIQNSFNISFFNSSLFGDISTTVLDSRNISFKQVFFGEAFSFNKDVSFENATGYLFNSSVTGNVSVSSSSEVFFYDMNETLSQFLGNATTYQYWTTYFSVINPLGAPLSAVYLSAINWFNSSLFLVPNYVNLYGNYSLPLLSYKRTPDNYTYYSNYTFNFTRSRYVPVSTSFNVTSIANHTILMKTSKNLIRSGSSCKNPSDFVLRDFCTDANPKLGIDCLNMGAGDVCEVEFVINATDNVGGDSSSLYYRNFSFFVIAESEFDFILMNESSSLNVTIIP